MKTLILALLLGLATQVNAQYVARVQADSATADFFASQRLRQFGHATLPDAEELLCLYGAIQDSTAYVLFIKPIATHEATPTSLRHDWCPLPTPALGVQYLGTWHTHNTHGAPNECSFSEIDMNSFAADPGPIMMISCHDGVKWVRHHLTTP